MCGPHPNSSVLFPSSHRIRAFLCYYSDSLQWPKTSSLHAGLIAHFLLSPISCTAAAHMAPSCCGGSYATVGWRGWLSCPSLLSLSLTYGNVSSKACLTQTSIKLPLNTLNKQMVTWSHLKHERRFRSCPNKIKSGTQSAWKSLLLPEQMIGQEQSS